MATERMGIKDFVPGIVIPTTEGDNFIIAEIQPKQWQELMDRLVHIEAQLEMLIRLSGVEQEDDLHG